MKRTLAAAAAAFAAGPLATVGAAVVSIETDAEVVNVGESFDVRLVFEAEGDEVLAAFNSDVFYDLADVELAGVSFLDPGTGVNQLALPGAFFLPDFGFVDFLEGVQVFGVSPNVDDQLVEGQADRFAFAVLTFAAVGNGTTDIGLGLFQQFFGAGLDVLDVTLGQDVVSVEVVPLPGALAFMLTGLAGLAVRRRLA